MDRSTIIILVQLNGKRIEQWKMVESEVDEVIIKSLLPLSRIRFVSVILYYHKPLE